MTTQNDTPIFSKARVSNVMAAAVVGSVIYAFVTGIPDTMVEGSLMAMLAGFAAKHLFDSSQS
jgi:hypothetical protein